MLSQIFKAAADVLMFGCLSFPVLVLQCGYQPYVRLLRCRAGPMTLSSAQRGELSIGFPSCIQVHRLSPCWKKQVLWVVVTTQGIFRAHQDAESTKRAASPAVAFEHRRLSGRAPKEQLLN